MPTTSVMRKPAGKAPANKNGARKQVDEEPKRRIRRLGTKADAFEGEELDTLGKRMAHRRLELRMTQAKVADEVNRLLDKLDLPPDGQFTMARTAYGMYETGGVEPELLKIDLIAKALKVSPGWLAFNEAKRTSVQQVYYDQGKRTFIEDDEWGMPETWLADQLAAKPENLALYMVTDFGYRNYRTGDMVLVRRERVPTVGGDEFVFVHKNNARIGRLAKTAGVQKADNPMIRVFAPDNKSHESVPLKNLKILGGVVGKVGVSHQSD